MQHKNDDATLIAWLHDEGELERARMAREIHDELGGTLVAVKMDLASLARGLAPLQATAQAQLARISSALDAAMTFERRLVDQLRPGVLEHLGLVAALRHQLQAVCERADLRYQEAYPENEPDLTAEAVTLIFRMQQAALQDLVDRGNTHSVDFRLAVNKSKLLEMRIASYSATPPPPATSGETHRVALQCHRARRLGGQCEVERRSDGVTLTVRLPLSRVAAPRRQDTALP